jgi:hypothetical protein
MKSIFLFILIIILPFKTKCQNISSFFSNSSEILDSIHCDFNYDGTGDIICITNDTNSFDRTLFFLEGLNNKDFKVVERNDTLIMRSYDGGMYGDPYNGMSYSNDTLNISFYGGTSWRWFYNYYYCYDRKSSEWYLFKEIYDETNLNNIEDIDDTTSYSDTTYFKRK